MAGLDFEEYVRRGLSSFAHGDHAIKIHVSFMVDESGRQQMCLYCNSCGSYVKALYDGFIVDRNKLSIGNKTVKKLVSEFRMFPEDCREAAKFNLVSEIMES